jgi:hypothetical protein
MFKYPKSIYKKLPTNKQKQNNPCATSILLKRRPNYQSISKLCKEYYIYIETSIYNNTMHLEMASKSSSIIYKTKE